MPTHVVRHDPAAARIAEIVTMRRQLCDEHVAIENQAAQLEDAMLRRLAKRRLARIETDIRLLEKRLTETIAAEADLARRYARLTSMPGVGPVLAFTLIALLPELGRMSRKQIAALVGLAPYDFDSGKLRDTAACRPHGSPGCTSSNPKPQRSLEVCWLRRRLVRGAASTGQCGLSPAPFASRPGTGASRPGSSRPASLCSP